MKMSTGFQRDRIQNPALREQMGRIRNATPVNAVAATGTLTFTDVGIDTETVTIGSHVYEIDTAADPGAITAGHYRVNCSGGASAAQTATALIAAITANTASLFSAATGGAGVVVITAKTKGTAANGVATTETCTNASWGAAVTASGVNGTPAYSGEMTYDDSYLYVFNGADNLSVSADKWERSATAAY
jgi:hypothetical protein